MKTMTAIVSAVLVLMFFAPLSAAEKEFTGTQATIHRMASPTPGNFQMAAPYRDGIQLYKLKKDDTAYWTPYGGKFISDGKYAYLWCAVMKTGKKSISHRWIAITDESLEQALDLANHTDGIAFYLLTYDGEQIHFKGYPYSTLQVMAAGIPTTEVPAKELAR